MFRLLRAGFFRLRKEAIFWTFIISSIIVSIFFFLTQWNSQFDSVVVVLDKIINEYSIFIGFFIAIFVSVFVGKEQMYGIIRNKIIVGHSRTAIYISKLIISILVSILCELIYILIVLILGKILNIKTNLSLPILSMSILDTILIIIVYCSIFNFVSMIFSEATVSTVINVIILVIFFVLAFYFGKIANEPKYYGSIMTYEGKVTVTDKYPNPNYPGDEKVKFAKNVEFSTPVGQAFSIFTLEEDTSMSALDDDNAILNTKEDILYAILIYSVTEICIINMLGIFIFSKRELK